MKYLKNHSGFGVMEAIFGMAIAVGTVFFIMQGLDFATKSNRTITGRSNLTLRMNDILQSLQNDNTCKIALGGQTFLPGGTVNDVQIVEPNGDVIKTNVTIGGGLAISRITLVDTGTAALPIQYEESPGTFISLNRRVANLTVEVKAADKMAVQGGIPAPRSLKVNLLTNGANQIVSCNGDLSTAEACIEAGGLYNSALPADRRCNMVPATCQRLGLQYLEGPNACGCPAGNIAMAQDDGTFQCENFAEILKENLPPLGGCLGGGGFASGGGPNSYNNPITGGQSCPAGFTAMAMGTMSASVISSCGKGGCSYVTYNTTHYQCNKCDF